MKPWLVQVVADMDDLVVNAEAEGGTAPSTETLTLAREAARVCSLADVSDPLVDHDGAGGVEIYFKEGDRALLIALRADGDLCVFRDGPAGSGRDRCQAGREGWTAWLAANLCHLAPL